MKTIVYTCPYVPAEWIAAHGLQPSRIMPRSARKTPAIDLTFGMCPYARAFVNKVLSDCTASAVIMTTVCDQMRHASDLVARDCDTPLFVMNVPSTWQTRTALHLYRTELERLGRFLIHVGGTAPSTHGLSEVMLKYDTARSSIRQARGHLAARQFSEAIAAFGRRACCELEKVATTRKTSGVPLALVGGPLVEEDFDLFDVVETWGGRIALDATESGERTLPAVFDRGQLHDDPLAELVRAYFGTIPDIFRRPNDGFYTYLGDMLSDRQIRGIIYYRYVWCDLWHAELHRLRQWTDRPVLDLDMGDDGESTRTRTEGRIQAFLEMLG